MAPINDVEPMDVEPMGIEEPKKRKVPRPIDIALLDAVEDKQSLEVIKSLVEQGANINYINRDSDTVFDSAVWTNEINLVKYFLDLGITQKIRNIGLLTAVTEGNFDMVKLLVQYGAHVEFDNSISYDSFRLIAEEGGLYILDYLISLGRFDVNRTNKKNLTALLYAAMNDDFEVVKYLVYKGAEVNCITNKHNTPLMHAAKNDDEEMVRFLLDNGANIHVKTKQKNRTALNIAAIDASVKIVNILIEVGADINNVDSYGMTPILNALLKHNLPVAEYLRTKGCDIFKKYKKGRTAFHLAAKFGFDVTVDYLLALGMDINAMDEDGLTPFHAAAIGDRLDMMQYMVNHGADYTKPLPNNKTLISFARHKKWRQMVNYLYSLN